MNDRDPAEIAAERAEEVKALIARAKAHEAKGDSKNVLAANNLRLKAICVQMRIE